MALTFAPKTRAGAVLEALLRPYAQIVFSRDLGVGLLVLAAVACRPWLALATLGAVGVAAIGSLAFGLGGRVVREGGIGCIAVLTTIALVVFAPEGGPPLALLLFGALLSVLCAASFQAVFSNVALPTHALPFIAATWLVHLAARAMPETAPLSSLAESAGWLPAGWQAASWLDLPAAIVFGQGQAAGALVLAALLVSLRTGWLAYLAGDYEAGEASYRAAMAAKPAALEAKIGLTLVLYVAQRWKALETACKQVLAEDPKHATVRARLASSHYATGNYPDAAAIYRKLVDSFPGELDYQTGLAWALLRMGKREEAVKLFRAVLALSPDNPNALQGMAAK